MGVLSYPYTVLLMLTLVLVLVLMLTMSSHGELPVLTYLNYPHPVTHYRTMGIQGARL